MPPEPLYRNSGALLLRAGTAPDQHPTQEDLTGNPRTWLRRAWSSPTVRNAIQAANPELHSRVEALATVQGGSDRSVRKTLTSMLGYLARRRRPTPFGLFAGVAPATVASRAAAQWGSDHHVHTRADQTWIAEVIEGLHACPELMARIPVKAHNLAVVRGDRLVIPGPPAGERAPRAAPVEVTTAHTSPVAAVMESARTSVPHRELIDRVGTQFPDASTERITALVDQLLAQGFLLSGLWAPTTEPDPLDHLCAVLDRLGAESITAVADLAKQVRSVHERLQEPSTLTTWPTKAPLREEMLRVTDATPVPLATDTTLDARVSITPQVVSTLERAADVLTRTTPHPFGAPAWRDYHARFRERYGPAATVPVQELVADSGLGLPAGYLGADRHTFATVLTARDSHLLEAAQEALADGDELDLTDELITRLGRTDGTPVTPPDRVEIAARIHAPTTKALDRGDFTAWITGAPRPGSSMFGRFLHMLRPQDGAQLADSFTHEVPGTVVAHLSFHARQRRNDNIVRTPPVASTVISLSEHRTPGENVIDLDDLAVTADATSLSLVRLSTGQRVITRVPHPLEPRNQTPPLARFLSEVGTARNAAYGPFDFGAASRLPRLPRVRHGKAVLSPARWTLTASDVPGTVADSTAWDRALATWQRRWQVPDQVALVEHDRHLPLDLSVSAHRYLLRRRFQAREANRVHLCESPTSDEVAWAGRPHEFVAALHADPSPAVARRPVHFVGERESAVPGSAVVNARFQVHPDRVQRLLLDHLSALVEAAGCARWWFRLRRDLSRVDAPTYLAVTLRASDPGRTSNVIDAVHDWATQARRAGLVPGVELVPHHPQHARFGDGSAAEAAEAVFHADSLAALAQRHLITRSGAEPSALAAASFVDLATGLLGSPRAAAQWLVHELEHTPGPLDPSVRRSALAWSGTEGPDHLWATSPGQNLCEVWESRTRALEIYQDALREIGRHPTEVLRSLLHLHHVRAWGVEPDAETVTIRAARAIALARTHRGRR